MPYKNSVLPYQIKCVKFSLIFIDKHKHFWQTTNNLAYMLQLQLTFCYTDNKINYNPVSRQCSCLIANFIIWGYSGNTTKAVTILRMLSAIIWCLQTVFESKNGRDGLGLHVVSTRRCLLNHDTWKNSSIERRVRRTVYFSFGSPYWRYIRESMLKLYPALNHLRSN